MNKIIRTVCFAVAAALLPAPAAAVRFSVVEYGSAQDHIGQVLAQALDPRKTPASIAVTDDGSLWFQETFTWHPRIAVFKKDGTFREFVDPYASTVNPCVAPESCITYDQEHSYLALTTFMPLAASGNSVKFGPLIKNPTRVMTFSENGSLGMQPASGCLAPGPNIACFPKSHIDLTFPMSYYSFNSGLREAIHPSSAVLGPDGNIWFTDIIHSQIGRVRPNGRIDLFVDGLTRWDSGPQFINVGPDGNLWFTEKRDRIGRITLDGKITEFSRGLAKRCSMGGIVAGPDGGLWFTLYHGMVLGRISTLGQMQFFHDLVYPSDGHENDPTGMIITDKQGRLYYNEAQAGRIARVTILN